MAARAVRCWHCEVTFLSLDEYLAHRARCFRVLRDRAVTALIVVAGVGVSWGFAALAEAANRAPGGAADWLRAGVALVVAVAGSAVAVHEMRRPR